MSRKTILFAVTCAALLGAGSAAVAQGRSGGVAGSVGAGLGGGAGGGIGVGLGGGIGGGIGGIRADGGLGADLRANTHGVDTRSSKRVRSRAPAKASATAVANANSNSVLAGSTVTGGTLAGLTVGMDVQDVSGTTIGTVERIQTSANGVVRNILVRSADGQRIIPLASDSLTVSGQTATAISVSPGANRRN